MFGSARDVDGGGSGQTADEASDRSAGVAGRTDVGIVQHGVAEPPDQAVRRRPRFRENIDDAVADRRIRCLVRMQPNAAERAPDRSGIDRVLHNGVANDEVAG